MYRSISTNRFSDEQYSYYSSLSPSSKVPTALRALSQQGLSDQLPLYEPVSESAKKERTRTTFAEKAVHAIPFVLLLCAFILWLFSNSDVDVRGNSIAGRAQAIAGRGELASDGTGHLSLHLGDLHHSSKLNTMFSRNIS